jgi:hypothetical protein
MRLAPSGSAIARRARVVLAALAALTATAATAQQTLPIGDAQYTYAFYELFDNDAGPGFAPGRRLVQIGSQAGGTLDVVRLIGGGGLGGRNFAGAYDSNNVFWAGTLTPVSFALAPLYGGEAFTYVAQSFRKESADASMSFLFNGGQLSLTNIAAPISDRPFFASLDFTALMLDNATGQELWRQSQSATLSYVPNAARTSASWSQVALTQQGSAGSPAIAPWTWTCTGCGGPAAGTVTANLVQPYTGAVDLSAVPVGGEVTVAFLLHSTAADAAQGEVTRALARVRDPVNGEGVGGGYFFNGLLPTDDPLPTELMPVPEPAPALLLAGGLAVIGWLKRRRRR